MHPAQINRHPGEAMGSGANFARIVHKTETPFNDPNNIHPCPERESCHTILYLSM
jgi:hypothetical protein